ncbi:MAG: DUF1538 domain-containing protein [Rhodospirillales bacterium]|nr:DUF1538 domain-containing protein [Rhodospirillales bacterium]
MSGLRRFRYGEFVREVAGNQRRVSANQLSAPAAGPAAAEETIRLRPIDVHRLLTPYLGIRMKDQLRAVLPLAAYLVLFQVIILRQNVSEGGLIAAGMVAVMLGLMLFIEGLKLGMMPFAELIGLYLPKRSRRRVVLLIAFILGIGVTLAEPAVGALQAAGSTVDPRQAPYLYAMLNAWSGALVLVIGVGVGLAAVLGTMRFLYGWSLKPLIIGTLLPALALTAYMMNRPDLAPVLGLAWDSGAITTGPVTVPIVLALGIGITAAAGRDDSALSGFGVVTLASLIPVLGVMVLALIVSMVSTPDEIVAAASGLSTAVPAWYEQSPAVEIVSGLRAIVPLVLFLYAVLTLLIREKVSQAKFVVTGLVFCLVGMIVFNLGLTYGLAKLGGQTGAVTPAAFTATAAVQGSPLYATGLGMALVLIFAWALGFGATIAEPALNAMGLTVENLTNGALPRRLLIGAVSLGVGIGIALGVVKIVFNVPLAPMLIGFYAVALGLSLISSEEFVNVAWDSAGVTTGPVTVPLVLAMGLGFGEAIRVVEGFGILAMASICPILTVLVVGLWIRYQQRRQESAKQKEELEAVQS